MKVIYSLFLVFKLTHIDKGAGAIGAAVGVIALDDFFEDFNGFGPLSSLFVSHSQIAKYIIVSGFYT